MAYQTWTRRANAIAAVKKALPTDCVAESVSAALVGVGSWEVTVKIDDTPSAADALQDVLGDKARVKALRLEPVPAVEEEMAQEGSPHTGAEEADKIVERRASADRQPTLKGQKLSVVGGKDAANPFREGSKSHATFAMVQANPGKTYEELRDMGARMRAITHSTKQGWIRAH